MGSQQIPAVVSQEVVSYGTAGTYTFSPPAGTSPSNPTYARVVITGAGGGGAAVIGGRSGAGGSAGQQIILPSVKITGDVSITVGTGGAGSSTAGATATAGGSSAFGSYTATGGAGAIAGVAGAATSLMPAQSQGGSGTDGTRMLMFANTSTTSARYTSDGTNWVTGNNAYGSSAPNCVWYNNGRFHAHTFSGSSGQWYFGYSTDGTTFNTINPSTAGNNVNSVAVSGNTMLAACDFPNGGGATATYMYSTNNGDSWANGTLPVSGQWGVALTNGTTWIQALKTTGANNVRSNTTLGGASAGWTARSAGSASNDWYGGAYGNGRFVLTSTGGLIYSSTDGATWTQRASGSGTLFVCSYLGNKFFTHDTNSSGTGYLYSTDGETWTSGNVNTNGATGNWAFGYLLGTYYAVTANGKVNVSSDGITWTLLTTLDAAFQSSGPIKQTIATGALGTITALVPTAPTSYGYDLVPSGGGGGNPTSTTGSGGSGGGYIALTAAASTGSAAATAGQVPGAGGGGGGTGSTAGAAGADGLVAIYL